MGGKRTFPPESATKPPLVQMFRRRAFGSRLGSGITRANSVAALRLYDFESMAKLADHNPADWAGALRTGSVARI